MRKKLLIGAFVLGATMLTNEVVPTAHVEYKVLASEAQAGNLVDVKVTPTGYHTVSLTDLTKDDIDLRENENYEYAWVDDSKNLNNAVWKPLKETEPPVNGGRGKEIVLDDAEEKHLVIRKKDDGVIIFTSQKLERERYDYKIRKLKINSKYWLELEAGSTALFDYKKHYGLPNDPDIVGSNDDDNWEFEKEKINTIQNIELQEGRKVTYFIRKSANGNKLASAIQKVVIRNLDPQDKITYEDIKNSSLTFDLIEDDTESSSPTGKAKVKLKISGLSKNFEDKKSELSYSIAPINGSGSSSDAKSIPYGAGKPDSLEIDAEGRIEINVDDINLFTIICQPIRFEDEIKQKGSDKIILGLQGADSYQIKKPNSGKFEDIPSGDITNEELRVADYGVYEIRKKGDLGKITLGDGNSTSVNIPSAVKSVEVKAPTSQSNPITSADLKKLTFTLKENKVHVAGLKGLDGKSSKLAYVVEGFSPNPILYGSEHADTVEINIGEEAVIGIQVDGNTILAITCELAELENVSEIKQKGSEKVISGLKQGYQIKKPGKENFEDVILTNGEEMQVDGYGTYQVRNKGNLGKINFGSGDSVNVKTPSASISVEVKQPVPQKQKITYEDLKLLKFTLKENKIHITGLANIKDRTGKLSYNVNQSSTEIPYGEGQKDKIEVEAKGTIEIKVDGTETLLTLTCTQATLENEGGIKQKGSEKVISGLKKGYQIRKQGSNEMFKDINLGNGVTEYTVSEYGVYEVRNKGDLGAVAVTDKQVNVKTPSKSKSVPVKAPAAPSTPSPSPSVPGPSPSVPSPAPSTPSPSPSNPSGGSQSNVIDSNTKAEKEKRTEETQKEKEIQESGEQKVEKEVKLDGLKKGSMTEVKLDRGYFPEAKSKVQVLKEGKAAYTVSVEKPLVAGESVKVFELMDDGSYVLVDNKRYKVKEKGFSLKLKEGKDYVLLNEKEAKKIEKQIVSSLKLKNKSLQMKDNQSKKIEFNSGFNTANLKKVSYKYNKKLISVSKGGVVKAKINNKTTTVTVMVTLKNGKKKSFKMKVVLK